MSRADWWALTALATFIVTVTGSTVLVCTAGHDGWHWLPFGLAVVVVGTMIPMCRAIG